MVNNQMVIEGWRGMAVDMGLKTPLSRALCAGVIAASASYALKRPRSKFTDRGTVRDMQGFLLMPVLIGGSVFLFT